MADALCSIARMAADLSPPAEKPDAARLGARGEPAWLRLDRLVIDRRYQREVNKQGIRNIYKIVREFDWAKYSPLIVSPAQGGVGEYAILDGQHRAIAAHLLGLEHVPCMVHQLDLQAQARVFRDVNQTVTKPSKLDLHHAAVLAGEPAAIAVHTVCQSAGVKMLSYNKALNLMRPDETVAVAMIGKVLRRHGFENALRALTILVEAGREGAGSLLGAWNISITAAAVAKCPGIDRSAAAGILVEHDLETRLEQARGVAPQGKAPDYVVAWLAGMFLAASREAA